MRCFGLKTCIVYNTHLLHSTHENLFQGLTFISFHKPHILFSQYRTHSLILLSALFFGEYMCLCVVSCIQVKIRQYVNLNQKLYMSRKFTIESKSMECTYGLHATRLISYILWSIRFVLLLRAQPALLY